MLAKKLALHGLRRAGAYWRPKTTYSLVLSLSPPSLRSKEVFGLVNHSSWQ